MAIEDINKVIIYPNPDGGLAVIYPAPQYLEDHSIEDIAKKDVPSGVLSYKIIHRDELPNDYDFREAWEYIE